MNINATFKPGLRAFVGEYFHTVVEVLEVFDRGVTRCLVRPIECLDGGALESTEPTMMAASDIHTLCPEHEALVRASWIARTAHPRPRGTTYADIVAQCEGLTEAVAAVRDLQIAVDDALRERFAPRLHHSLHAWWLREVTLMMYGMLPSPA